MNISNLDREISFFPSKSIQPLAKRAIVGALGFQGLSQSAPPDGAGLTPLFRGMVHLSAGQNWALAQPVLGGAMAVMVMEELFRRGVKEVVFLGLAGSLTPDLTPGDLWCPQFGLSTEGTSAHYPAPLEPDNELHNRVLNLGSEMGLAVHSGIHWSTDGFYRETVGIVDKHRAAGALAVDMECTALWAAARFRGIKLVALMVISDLIDAGEHHLGFDLPEFALGLNQAASLAWKTIGDLAPAVP